MARVHVKVFDINTDELIANFDSCDSASKYLSRHANEKYGLNTKKGTFTNKILWNMKHKTDDGKLGLPDIGLKLWRSFPCMKCRSGQYFENKNVVCEKCVEWQKRFDEDKRRLDKDRKNFPWCYDSSGRYIFGCKRYPGEFGGDRGFK